MNIDSAAAPNAASSITASNSKLIDTPSGLKSVDPIRTQRPSTTLVFACIISPRHSQMRTPLRRSRWYDRDISPRSQKWSYRLGTSTLTSKQSRAAPDSSSISYDDCMK